MSQGSIKSHNESLDLFAAPAHIAGMTTTAPRQRFHLISNSKSGTGAGASLEQKAAKIAEELGFELVHHNITNPNELNAKAQEAVQAATHDGGIVAAAGGDGTVRGVAQFLVGKPTPFAVIPCGTFNLFARTHNIPEEAEAALRLAMTGKATPVRIGKVNDEIFVLNASLGLYAKVIEDRKARTHRWGRHRIVALISTMISLLEGHRLLDVHLCMNGQTTEVKTPMIFIGNNSLQLRNLALKIAECMKKDLLAVVMMRSMNRWKMLRILFRGIAHTLEKEESLDSFCVDSLTIHTRKKRQRIALDGEMFHLASPFVITALPGALTLIKP